MKRKSENGNKQSFPRKNTELVFDPEKRAEFLSGFHKRKMHRKKVAKGEMQRKLKEETKRIRTKAKENMKKLYHSYKPIPELMEKEEDEDHEEEYDTENVTVKVVELSTTELAKEHNWIGENRSQIRNDESEPEEAQSDDEESDNYQLGVVPGMQLDGEKKIKRKTVPDEANEATGDDERKKGQGKEANKSKQEKGPVLNLEGIRSKKELKHKLKRFSLKSMKQSQAFRQKARLQQLKQLKKSRRVQHFKEKHLKQKKGFNKHASGGRREDRRKRPNDD